MVQSHVPSGLLQHPLGSSGCAGLTGSLEGDESWRCVCCVTARVWLSPQCTGAAAVSACVPWLFPVACLVMQSQDFPTCACRNIGCISRTFNLSLQMNLCSCSHCVVGFTSAFLLCPGGNNFHFSQENHLPGSLFSNPGVLLRKQSGLADLKKDGKLLRLR